MRKEVVKMPIYSYVCKDCAAKFDLLVRANTKDNEKVCEKCSSKNIERTFAPFAVRTGSLSSSSPSCPTGTCPLSP
jgi:putative FmdB family regulatory protein